MQAGYHRLCALGRERLATTLMQQAGAITSLDRECHGQVQEEAGPEALAPHQAAPLDRQPQAAESFKTAHGTLPPAGSATPVVGHGSGVEGQQGPAGGSKLSSPQTSGSNRQRPGSGCGGGSRLPARSGKVEALIRVMASGEQERYWSKAQLAE